MGALSAQPAPGEQERIAAEIERELGSRMPAVNDLGRLELTPGVLREALRLYPPVYGTGRQAVQDCTVAGIAVKRGTVVLPCITRLAGSVTPTPSFRLAGWSDPSARCRMACSRRSTSARGAA